MRLETQTAYIPTTTSTVIRGFESRSQEVTFRRRFVPFYIQVDAGITRRVPLPNNRGTLEFRGAVVNLFDRTYLVRNGTGIGVFADQYGPRRALYGGIKYEFPFTKPPSVQTP